MRYRASAPSGVALREHAVGHLDQRLEVLPSRTDELHQRIRRPGPRFAIEMLEVTASAVVPAELAIGHRQEVASFAVIRSSSDGLLEKLGGLLESPPPACDLAAAEVPPRVVRSLDDECGVHLLGSVELSVGEEEVSEPEIGHWIVGLERERLAKRFDALAGLSPSRCEYSQVVGPGGVSWSEALRDLVRAARQGVITVGVVEAAQLAVSVGAGRVAADGGYSLLDRCSKRSIERPEVIDLRNLGDLRRLKSPAVRRSSCATGPARRTELRALR